jgi:hypothetical protein
MQIILFLSSAFGVFPLMGRLPSEELMASVSY